tara:strand:- start:219 stop:428 length:210 start_codon:yes stop_codon:yes gene_type:complete
MNSIKKYFTKLPICSKSRAFNSVIWEFTVFIKVNIESLNDCSKDKPDIEIIVDKKINEIIKINIERKYL